MIQKDLIFSEIEEDFKHFLDFNIKKCAISTDRLVTYYGALEFESLKFETLPKAFKYFKIIKGGLFFENCNNLKSLKGLENLKTIEGSFGISYCNNLENFKGIENLETIVEDFIYFNNNNHLIPFNHLKKLEILGNFITKNIDLKNLKDVEQILKLKINGRIQPKDLEYAIKEIKLSKTIEQALKDV